MTERVEITTVHDRLEACETIEQLARKLCLEEAKEAGIDRVAEVSEEDMEFAHALLLSWLQSHPGQQIRDRFASSRAKPVHANQEYIERKRLGLVRSNGNGQQGR
jgi:hypothetical protein